MTKTEYLGAIELAAKALKGKPSNEMIDAIYDRCQHYQRVDLEWAVDQLVDDQVNFPTRSKIMQLVRDSARKNHRLPDQDRHAGCARCESGAVHAWKVTESGAEYFIFRCECAKESGVPLWAERHANLGYLSAADGWDEVRAWNVWKTRYPRKIA